jgi:hypothetical protein
MTFDDVVCVGMHFRNAQAREIASALEPGNELLLDREPENPYDPNAIRVLYDLDGEPIHIGYVEREKAIYIADELDAHGGTGTATVTAMQSRGRNLHPVLRIEFEE